MNKIFSPKGIVACKPFVSNQIRTEIRDGIGRIAQKSNIEFLEVAFAAPDALGKGLAPGDKVGVRAETMVTPWAKKIFTIDGADVILVPEMEVLLVQPK